MTGELSPDVKEYKDLCDNSNDLMQSVTPDGRFRYVNHAWLRILGYSRPQISKMTFFNVIHPDEIEHCQELFMRAMSGEDVGLVATAFVTRDGRKVLVEGNVNCYFADGKPVYTRAIFRDVTRRRQAEEELKRSHEFFRKVFNSISDAVSIINVDDFTIAGANEVFLRTYGLKEEEVIGRTCYEVTHQRSAPCAPPDDICPLNEIITTGEHVVVDHVHYGKDGEKRYVEVSVFPVKDDSGRTVQVVHATRDITERKQAEEKLESSEVRLRSVIETANDAVVVSDSSSDIVSWNQAAVNIFGYTRDEIIGKPVVTIMPSRFREAHRQGMKRVTTTGESHVIGSTVEVVGLRKDGTEIPLELSLASWKVKEGQFFTAIIRDITKRKRIEEEIKRNRDYLEKLNNSLEEVIFTITLPDRTIEYVNRAVEAVFGYTPEECIGRNTEFLHKSKQAYIEVGKRFSSAVEDNKSAFELEFQARKKDGKVIDVDTNFTLIKEHGEITRVISVFRDVTERKQTEEALRESEERYRAILELSGEVGEAVVMLQDTADKKAVHSFATEEWSHITGYSMEELLGMSWFELLHPDYREEAFERYQRRLDGEVISGLFEVSIVRKDGTAVPIQNITNQTTYRGKFALVIYARDITGPKKAEREREKLIQELQKTLQEVKTLSGLLPICAWCKKFRDDEGYWESVEDYLGERTGAEFTHGICPECAAKFFDHS